MAKDDKVYFWIGAGVVQIGKKEYGAEKPLPLDKIAPAQLNKWIKARKVGEKIQAVTVDYAAEIKTLKADLKESGLSIDELSMACESKDMRIAELEELLEAATK